MSHGGDTAHIQWNKRRHKVLSVLKVEIQIVCRGESVVLDIFCVGEAAVCHTFQPGCRKFSNTRMSSLLRYSMNPCALRATGYQ